MERRGGDDGRNAGVVLDLGELSRRAEADEYRVLGEERQAKGDIEDAAAYFQMSLELYPTAETHVALGNALAARGRWDEAIGECEKAIALDPDLGNSYNDLGVYLDRKASESTAREERRLLTDAALRYFDRALLAPTYDCRHYPHYHRGRILEQRGRFSEARDAYYTALQIEPGWEPAMSAWHRILGYLN